MPEARLHDGSLLDVEVHGDGPTVLLAVNPRPIEVRKPRRCEGGAVDIAGPVVNRRAELESLGWDVRVLDGLDHMKAMQAANVLPILRPWLVSTLARGRT